MAKDPNLKVTVTSDTSKFKKGMDDAKKQLRDFESVSDDVMSSIGDALGLSFPQIEKLANAFKHVGGEMAKSGDKGVAALGRVAQAIGAIQIAGVAASVGALVQGFKMLSEEAENFKQQAQGINIEMATAAYIDTYKQVLADYRGDTAKAIAETDSQWKKFWASMGAGFRHGALTGQFGMDGFDSATISPDAYKKRMEDAQKYAAELGNAADKAFVASQLMDALASSNKAYSEDTRLIADYDQDIAKYKLIAKDTTKDLATRQEALVKVQDLISKRYLLENRYLENQYRLQDQINALGSSTAETLAQADASYVKYANNRAKADNARRELLEIEKQITNEITKQANIEAEAAAEAKALKEAADKKRKEILPSVAPVVGKATTEVGATIPVEFKIEERSITDLSEDIKGIMADLAASVGESFGNLMGDLINGEDAFGNFGESMLTTLADLAVQVGKIAIAVGTAVLGIQASLSSFNPWAAIGAGVALVALGSMAKRALSNSATSAGGYSAAPSLSSGSYASTASGNNWHERNTEVKVTGTLQASGSQLLAVIDNENYRKNRTT